MDLDVGLPAVPGGRVAPLAPGREYADEAVRAPSCRADGHDGPLRVCRVENVDSGLHEFTESRHGFRGHQQIRLPPGEHPQDDRAVGGRPPCDFAGERAD